MVNRIDAASNLDEQGRFQSDPSPLNGKGGMPSEDSTSNNGKYRGTPFQLTPISTSTKVISQSSDTANLPSVRNRPFLVRWFCNLPVGRKETIALFACELIPILGFGIGSTIVLTNSLQTQLVDQAKSEVAATETSYNTKVNQMVFGSGGQADNSTLINAARSWRRGEPVAADLQNQVKQILRNEIKARRMEYATLVGKDLRIVVNANSNRQGEVFNPDDLVSKVFKTPQPIKANGIVAWDELSKEGAPLPSGFANKDALIRYAVTPVRDPATQEVIGALIFGDIVNEKPSIVEETLKSFNSGYSAIYLRQPNGEFSLATSLDKGTAQDSESPQKNVPLPDTSLLTAATAAGPGKAVVERVMINGRPYTVAAIAIPNQLTETPDGPVPSFSKEPVAILVRGTSEDTVNGLIQGSLLQQAIVLVLGIAAILLWSRAFRKAVLQPLRQLEKTTQDFAEGNREARVQVFSLDEVGQLAMTFNEMANSIVEAEAILEEAAKNYERQSKQADLLNRVILRIRQTLSMSSIMQTGVDEVRDYLKADRVLIYTFHDGWVSGTITAESVGSGWVKALGQVIEDPLVEGAIDRYSSGRIWYTNNIYKDNLSHCHCQILERLQVKANIVAPIKMNGKLIGLLCAHQCSGAREWQPAEIDLFGQLAAQIGYALDQASLLKRQEEATQKARQLNEITAHLRESLDREQIYNTVVRELRDVLATDRAVVYLFNHKWQGRVVAESVGRGWPPALGANIVDPCFAESYVEKYQRGRVQALSNIYEAHLDKCYLGQLEPFEVKANIVAPIVVNEHLMGLLVTHQCSSSRNWQEGEINLMRQVAIQLGFALEQATLLEEQQEKADFDRLLNDVTLNIRQTLVREDILNIAAKELRKAMDADRVVIYLFNPDFTGTIRAESVVKGCKSILGETVNDPFRKGLIDEYRDGRVRVMADIYAEELTSCHVDILEGFEIKASISAPILEGDRLLGLVCVHQCSGPRAWKEIEANFFRKAAIQVGYSLEQATLLEQREQARLKAEAISQEQQQQRETLQNLSNITAHLRESLNREQIHNTVVRELREALVADRVIVYVFDDKWQGKVVAESVGRNYPAALGASIVDPCFAQAYIEKYKRGRVQALSNIYEADLDHCYLGQLEPFEVKANVVAPIVVNEHLMGLLVSHQCSGPRNWQDREINLIRQVAIQLGFALEQATLLEQREQARLKAEAISQEQQQQKETLQMQLVELLSDVEGAAGGDLTVRADVTAGDIGTVADFFNSIIESLRQIVTQVKQSAIQVNSALGENDGAIRHLADEAMKQAHETTLTLKSVEEMTQSIRAVADSASMAAQVTHTASTTAQAGGAAMDLTVQNILSLRETIGETAKKVKRLGESSQKISKVVSLINQIALQTNLLAINAGIEAARAGEEGQGFAVVAEEVGELAARSAAATQEIEQIVENIQRETNEVVEAMEQGTTQVVEGTHLVENAKESLQQILDVSRQIDQLVQSISDATVSQVQTSQTITNLMEEVASIAGRTSDSSHQVSKSLRQTVEIAQELQESVGTFKVN